MKKSILVILALGFSLAASQVWAAGEIIKVDGSSTVFPITEAVAEEFGKIGGGKVIVGISGTGGGFKRFCRGETDVSNASRPIKESEITACKEMGIEFIELPVAYDGLAVMVNPKNTWIDYLTVSELNKIWKTEAQGVITRWNQIRSSFPDKEIRLYGPGTDSGTFDYFTEAINGKSGNSRGDYTASEDDNVLVEGISNDEGGLGYFGLAYFKQNSDKLKLVPIDDANSSNGSGPILPSTETVMDSTYQPLARPLFIYVNKASIDKETVKKFISFYLDSASELAGEVGYISLGNETYQAAKRRFERGIHGSVFSGINTVGVKIENLL